MTTLFFYLIKVMAIHGLLLACFYLVFKRTDEHQLNRLYLLISILFAFIIPLLEITIPKSLNLLPQPEQLPALFQGIDSQQLIMIPVVQSGFNWNLGSILFLIYGLITCIMLTRFVFHLLVLKLLRKRSEVEVMADLRLYKTEQTQPFSFFKSVFMPADLYGTPEFDQILAHESVHVKQLHSLDRLLMDFAVSLFWFNPFMYLYRKALIEIHEYQADQAVINRFQDPIGYQEILFSRLRIPGYSGVVSHFNFSILKKRVVMMNKRKNTHLNWIYAMTLPVVCTLIYVFASRIQDDTSVPQTAGVAQLINHSSEWSLSGLTFAQQDDVPAILPLEQSQKVRVTSTFGMRYNPMTKKKQQHTGIDFAVPTGTQVLATADGVIDLAKEHGNHGNRVIINHGLLYQTSYSHLSRLDVRPGQVVKKGQVIGLSGNTGKSTAPHLHYEVIDVKKGPVEPKPFISDYALILNDC